MNKTYRIRILPLVVLTGLALTLSLTGPLAAAERTIVVVERSNDATDDTNHTPNCQNLPAGGTKVEAGNVTQAVSRVNGALGAGDCVKNLHFRGHGKSGQQNVGGGVKANSPGERINGTKTEWCDKLKGINFCAGATIHLWGCNVGSGHDGACKLKEIADCTGTKVRGAVNVVNAGQQESYTGPICETEPNKPKPACQEPTDEKGKKKKKLKTEDIGCANDPQEPTFGSGDGLVNTEDVGCDGLPETYDLGEGDGLLNLAGGEENGCLDGPGEDTGCDNLPGTFDFGEGDGFLNTEDVDGSNELSVFETVDVDVEPIPEEDEPGRVPRQAGLDGRDP